MEYAGIVIKFGGTLPSISFHFMVALQFTACIMQSGQKRECKEEGRKKGNMENKKRGGGRADVKGTKLQLSRQSTKHTCALARPTPCLLIQPPLALLSLRPCSRLTDFLFLGHTHLFPIPASLHTRSSLCVDPILALSPHPGQASALLVPLCRN